MKLFEKFLSNKKGMEEREVIVIIILAVIFFIFLAFVVRKVLIQGGLL